MSAPINDGGPAFPQTNDSWHGKDRYPACPSGMSIRVHFAGQFMAAMLTSPSDETHESLAVSAVDAADALIERLKR